MTNEIWSPELMWIKPEDVKVSGLYVMSMGSVLGENCCVVHIKEDDCYIDDNPEPYKREMIYRAHNEFENYPVNDIVDTYVMFFGPINVSTKTPG